MPPIVGTARSSTVADAILPPVGGVSNGKARCAGVMPSPPFGRTSAQHRANAILRLEKFFPLRGTLFFTSDCASLFPVMAKQKKKAPPKRKWIRRLIDFYVRKI